MILLILHPPSPTPPKRCPSIIIRVANLVTYGVEVRKLCASCDEEVDVFGNTAFDAKGLEYCTGYGKDATVSGLLVIPTDAATGLNVIDGPLTVSL